MAEAFGAKIIDELRFETLGSVLDEVYIRSLEKFRPTGWEVLDQLLEVQNEEGRARNLQRDVRCPVIEISDLNPGAGKDKLLYRLLPDLLASSTTVEDDSSKGLVIWIDLDHSLSLTTLHDVLTGHNPVEFVHANQHPNPKQDEVSLKHLHVFRPQSTAELIEVLASIPEYLLDLSTHQSAGLPLRAIMINPLSSFLWQDRAADENARLDPPAAEDAPHLKLEDNWRSIVRLFREIHDLFKCTIFAGDNCLAQPKSLDPVVTKPHLPGVWNAFVTLRLVIEKSRLSRFPPGISAEEALMQFKLDDTALPQNVRHSVKIDHWGSDSWSSRFRNAVIDVEFERRLDFIVGPVEESREEDQPFESSPPWETLARDPSP